MKFSVNIVQSGYWVNGWADSWWIYMLCINHVGYKSCSQLYLLFGGSIKCWFWRAIERSIGEIGGIMMWYCGQQIGRLPASWFSLSYSIADWKWQTQAALLHNSKAWCHTFYNTFGTDESVTFWDKHLFSIWT